MTDKMNRIDGAIAKLVKAGKADPKNKHTARLRGIAGLLGVLSDGDLKELLNLGWRCERTSKTAKDRAIKLP